MQNCYYLAHMSILNLAILHNHKMKNRHEILFGELQKFKYNGTDVIAIL